MNYKTIKAALADGCWRKQDSCNLYGGEDIVVKGVVLVKNPKWALSESKWRKKGMKPINSWQYHTQIDYKVFGDVYKMELYREDQVIPIRTRAVRKIDRFIERWNESVEKQCAK